MPCNLNAEYRVSVVLGLAIPTREEVQHILGAECTECDDAVSALSRLEHHRRTKAKTPDVAGGLEGLFAAIAYTDPTGEDTPEKVRERELAFIDALPEPRTKGCLSIERRMQIARWIVSGDGPPLTVEESAHISPEGCDGCTSFVGMLISKSIIESPRFAPR